MNKEGFLILLELCTVYFAFQYAAVFDPAAGFQARRLLVVIATPSSQRCAVRFVQLAALEIFRILKSCNDSIFFVILEKCNF